jgi:hypothetical protein
VSGFAGAASVPPDPWREWLPPLQQRWDAEVGSAAVPWFAEIKRQQGAFATFLGVVVEGERWRALAIGDSCLFHIRAGRLQRVFPLASPDEFGTTPWLVGSRGPCDPALEERSRRAEGDWQPRDRLWLMTDALALWFLEETGQGGKPWRELENILHAPVPAEAFAGWVDKLRDAHRLRNDDVTLMLVQR